MHFDVTDVISWVELHQRNAKNHQFTIGNIFQPTNAVGLFLSASAHFLNTFIRFTSVRYANQLNIKQPVLISYGVDNTAAALASEGEVVVRSPTNMAAAKIAAVDFNKMTSK